MLDLIRSPDVLGSHALRGLTAQGEFAPPFPAAIEQLQFTWQLQPDAAREPVEMRWIAADTGGIASSNHVISSSKSEPGKTAGEFTLSKPTNGFPPGTYRLELLQGGKIIYSETFEIRKAE